MIQSADKNTIQTALICGAAEPEELRHRYPLTQVKPTQCVSTTSSEYLILHPSTTFHHHLKGRFSEDLDTSGYLQRVFQSVVQFHDGCLVSTAVAVVWSTKDGHHILIMAPVVALTIQQHS